MEARYQIGMESNMVDLNPCDLIVAPPSLADERFGGTVIMLVNHIPTMGSVGLCLNRPLFITIKDVLQDDTITGEFLESDLYWGGPVQEETLWMLHTMDWRIEETIQISDEWGITSNKSMFTYLTPQHHPKEYRMFMGYCSWESGQLMAELTGIPPFSKKESWLTIQDMNPEDVLCADPESMWEEGCELACGQAVDKIFGVESEA